MELIKFENLALDAVGEEDYAVFGGTFDPIHEGHVSVIRRLVPVFSAVIIAATQANPWKAEVPASAAIRIEMIRLVLSAEGLAMAGGTKELGISISGYSYSYSEELVDHLRASRPGKLFWAVGADNADSVKDWRNWKSKNVPTVVLPIEIDAHAVLVRRGKAEAHPAIRTFIRERKLYEHP